MKDQELIEFLCEENEAFAKDLADGHDLVSTFDGHFVAWDEIIEACGNGMEGYSESPIELISRIRNERDELRERCTNLKDELRMFYQADGSGILLDSPEECKRLRILAAQENKRLRDAISWALGEGDSDFGESKPENAPVFWWRKELRRRAESV